MKSTPDSPWIMGEGNKALETEMFYNYGRLKKKWKFMEKKEKENDLFYHLDWLMEKAKMAQPVRTCPHCGTRKIDYFGVAVLLRRDEFKVDGRYVCCKNGGCSRMVRAAAFASKVQFYMFTFENLSKVKDRFGANGNLLRLYASAFGLKAISPYETFRFFKEL